MACWGINEVSVQKSNICHLINYFWFISTESLIDIMDHVQENNSVLMIPKDADLL